jgi:hypothetical protein
MLPVKSAWLLLTVNAMLDNLEMDFISDEYLGGMGGDDGPSPYLNG